MPIIFVSVLKATDTIRSTETRCASNVLIVHAVKRFSDELIITRCFWITADIITLLTFTIGLPKNHRHCKIKLLLCKMLSIILKDPILLYF